MMLDFRPRHACRKADSLRSFEFVGPFRGHDVRPPRWRVSSVGFPVSAIAGEVTPLLVIDSGRLDRLAVVLVFNDYVNFEVC